MGSTASSCLAKAHVSTVARVAEQSFFDGILVPRIGSLNVARYLGEA